MVVCGRDVGLDKAENLASEMHRWAGNGSEWPRHRSRQGRGPGIGDAGGLEVVVSGRDIDLATGRGPGIGDAGGLDVLVSGRDVDLAKAEDLASEVQEDWKL